MSPPDDLITVHCPACGREYHIAAAHAGQHGKCACGHVLIVPHPDAPPGTIKCSACGRWTRPEGWCEWWCAPLETREPVELHTAVAALAPAAPDADQPSWPARVRQGALDLLLRYLGLAAVCALMGVLPGRSGKSLLQDGGPQAYWVWVSVGPLVMVLLSYLRWRPRGIWTGQWGSDVED